MKLRLPHKLQAALLAAFTAVALTAPQTQAFEQAVWTFENNSYAPITNVTGTSESTTGTVTFTDSGKDVGDVFGNYMLTQDLGDALTVGDGAYVIENSSYWTNGDGKLAMGKNSGAQSFTVVAWMKWDNVSGELFFLGTGNGNTSGTALGLQNSNVDFLFKSKAHKTVSNTSGLVKAGEWVNLAYVYDASGTASFYLNGELKGTLTGLSSQDYAQPGAEKLYIGAASTHGDQDNFAGSIAELGIYSGALTQEQILEKAHLVLPMIWNAQGESAEWDTATANWMKNGEADKTYESGSDVLFGTGDGLAKTVNVSQDVTAKSISVAADYTFTGSGVTANSLAFREGASLAIQNSVTLTGQTDFAALSHVTLAAGSTLALTAGDKSVINLAAGSAGTLEVKGGSVSYHSNLGGATLQLDAGTTLIFDNASGDTTHAYNGNIVLGGNVDIQVYGDSQHPDGVSITGNISGSGKTLTKKDLGNVTINGKVELGTLDVQNGNVTINGNESDKGSIGTLKAAQGKTVELVNTNATLVNAERGYNGNLTIGDGSTATASRDDGWAYNQTNTLTIKTGGTLNMDNKRWTFENRNTVILAGGVITGNGNATYGAIDFNGNNTVNVTANSTISARLRIRGCEVTFNVDEDQTLDFSGGIVFGNAGNDGKGIVTKVGAGTMIMSGNNAMPSGAVKLNAGTIRMGHANAFGGGSITQGGGVLEIAATADLTGKLTQTAGSIKVAENGALTLNNTTLAGALSVDDGGTLTLTGTTLAGTIANAGTVNLSGSISATDLEAGEVQIKYVDASGASTDNGNGFKQASGTYYVVKGEGDLNLTGTVTVGFAGGTHELQTNGQIALNGEADLTSYYMQVADTTESYSAIKTAAGATNVETIHLNAGNTSVNMNEASTGVNVAVADGISAQLTVSADTTLGNILVSTANTQLTVDGTANLTLGAGSLTGAGTVAFNGPTTNLTGANSGFTGIVSVMGGTVNLQNNNALTSATVQVGEGGTLVLSVHGTNDNGAGMPGSITGTGTVKITDSNFQYHSAGYLEAFAGTVVIADNGLVHMGNMGNKFAAATLEVATGGTLHGWGATFTHSITLSGGTLGDDKDNQTYSGAITLAAGTDSHVTATSGKTVTLSGVIGGEGGLVISGPGTVKLSGANTYTGKTEVTGGTLDITGSINPASKVVVAADAKITGSGADAKMVGIASGATATFTGAITGGDDGVSFTRQGGVQVTNTSVGSDPVLYSLDKTELRVTADKLTANSETDVTVGNQLAVSTVENAGTGAISLTTGEDLSAIKNVFAISGNIHFLNVGDEAHAVLDTLQLANGKTVSFNTDDVAGEADEATVTVAGMLLAEGTGSKLEANLVLGGTPDAPAVLDVSAMEGMGGLWMGSSVTLNSGTIALSEGDMELITGLDFKDKYDLFNGVDSFTVGETTYSQIGMADTWVNAREVFTDLALPTEKDYYLFYSGAGAAGGKGGNVGTIYIMQIPEPTTGTLSLLALCALAARRRKH